MSLPNGTRLGPYELVALLGAGGMGEVYKGRDTRLDRTVAVKVLPRRYADDPERRARLEREARAISSLNHPHICSLFDVGNQDGLEYLVMEYVEGEALDRRLERGPLPLDQVLRVGCEIAGALERAHRQGIVHRDLKPGNIMLTRAGAKLLDFGIAKARTGPPSGVELTTPGGVPTNTPLTGAGLIVGTMHYMAPEQLEAREIDGRADIFALGAVLYEMSTGRRAFEGTSQASLIAAILERQPPSISDVQPLTPRSLERLIRTCLAKDPDDRWQSAHDVCLELQAIGEAAAPQILSSRSAKRRRTERLGWAALATLLTAGLVVALATRRGTAATGPALRVALLPPAGVTAAGPFALAPDAHAVAFVGNGEDGVPRLWVRSLDDINAHELAGTEDASLPFWSPDGHAIGFFAQRKLKRIELTGGPPRTLADVSDARGGSWSRDDVIVFAPNPGDGLYRIAADGGAVAPVTRLDPRHGESSHRWPTVLPDGKRVLYFALSSDTERESLAVAPVEGSAGEPPRRVFAADSGATLAAPDRLLFIRGQTLLAQHVDLRTLQAAGPPQALADRVWHDPDLDGLFAFSAAGGGMIAYRQGGNELTRLVWFDRAGHELGALGAAGIGSAVALSADGRRVARSVTEEGSTTGGLWLLDLVSQASSRLSFNHWNDIYPVWSPDGHRLAFASDRSGSYNMYVKAADGSGEESLLLPSKLWEFAEDWSRDGRWLAFTRRDPRTKSDIWMLSLADRSAHALLQTEADELQPRLSPDGRFFAYVSDASGRSEVYVQTLPPTAAKWQLSTAGGFQPQWRRDGRELYFLAPDLRLMAVPIAAGASFSAGPPQPLFLTRIRRSSLRGASPYLAALDGQRFLVDSTTGPDLSSPIQLIVGTHLAG